MIPGEAIVVGDLAGNHATFVVNSIISPTQANISWLNAPGDSSSGTALTVANGAYTAPGGFPGTAVSGTNAFTILTANATVPLDLVTTVTFQVANSQWITVGQTIVVGDATDGVATFKVTAVPDTTHVTCLYLNARGDVGFGSPLLVANGATVSPSGSPEPIPFRYMQANDAGPANSGVGATLLMSVTVPGGTLVNVGDSIEIEAVFKIANTANGKTIILQWGSVTLVTYGSSTQALTTVIMRGRVVRTGANSQLVYASAVTQGSAVATVVDTGYATAAANLAVGNTVSCTGTGGANSDIIQTILMVRAATL